jgi:hypothetical protein
VCNSANPFNLSSVIVVLFQLLSLRSAEKDLLHETDPTGTAGDANDTACLYFKVNVFFPFIDHCVVQLEE